MGVCMKKLLLMFSTLLVLTACGDNDESSVQEVEQPVELETSYETIELDDITNYIDEGYTVVDVREIDEYESGHIPNALNAPLSDLENDTFTALETNEKYVIICQSGNRSITASNILSEAGYDIVNVSEGMSTWTGEMEE